MSEDNMQAVIDAARKAAEPNVLFKGDAFAKVFIPRGRDGTGEIVDIDLEKTLPFPVRKRGRVTVFDAASFNQIIADNGDAGNIAIYLDRNPEAPSIVAVLNGHGKDGAGWGDFRVNISFRPTPQWQKWRQIDGQMMAQSEFAEFIEDNIADIAEPAGATMLEIATYLQATRTTNFKSGIRLSSGAVQFQNLEDVNAQVGAGLMAVPETFTLALSPLFGAPLYRVPARFRWRLVDGKLRLGIKLQRVEDLMGTLIEDVIAKIERGSNVSVVDGLPPA